MIHLYKHVKKCIPSRKAKYTEKLNGEHPPYDIENLKQFFMKEPTWNGSNQQNALGALKGGIISLVVLVVTFTGVASTYQDKNKHETTTGRYLMLH